MQGFRICASQVAAARFAERTSFFTSDWPVVDPISPLNVRAPMLDRVEWWGAALTVAGAVCWLAVRFLPLPQTLQAASIAVQSALTLRFFNPDSTSQTPNRIDPQTLNHQPSTPNPQPQLQNPQNKSRHPQIVPSNPKILNRNP